jgi:hypothetical protein
LVQSLPARCPRISDDQTGSSSQTERFDVVGSVLENSLQLSKSVSTSIGFEKQFGQVHPKGGIVGVAGDGRFDGSYHGWVRNHQDSSYATTGRYLSSARQKDVHVRSNAAQPTGNPKCRSKWHRPWKNYEVSGSPNRWP